MKYLKYIFGFLFIIGMETSCDEDILTETPKDFLSPENAFLVKSDFESALANIYLTIRSNCYAIGAWTSGRNNFLGCDFDIMCSTSYNVEYAPSFYWNTMNADNSIVEKWWGYYFNWVYQANVIIDRAEESSASWNTEDDKNAIVGEAMFLRAFAYHFLANMWGGVPLVLEETTSPKFNYTRATQEEVYKQCKEDLEFAIQWMPTVEKLDGGRAPRAAAYHLLAEINICMEDYDAAIAAATHVISDPNFHLMTERFGKWINFEFNGYDYKGQNETWGDIYWDLFQEGNMNWQDGNHEAIWNTEFEYNKIGGGGDKFQMESIGPQWWVQSDKDGVANIQKDTLCGRPNSGTSLTDYVIDRLWRYKGDWDRDIRNSKYNFQREYYWLNPKSKYYGQPATVDNVSAGVAYYFDINFRPSTKKTVTAVHHGMAQTSTGQNHDYGYIYKDWYIMRLPETYLLRAEAYYRKGDNMNAAADINVIRNRAHATPVNSGDVDLDLILDERARELYIEEFRGSTLLRMGKLTEYLMKYNTGVVANNYVLDDHLNLFPIPSSEIQANKEAKLEQNPGY